MIDIAIVAATAVGKILVPFLMKHGEKLADDVGGAAVEGVEGVAASIWEQVKGRFSRSDAGKTRIEDFRQDPEGLQSTIKRELERMLAEDEQFATDLDNLVRSPEAQSVQQIYGTGVILKDSPVGDQAIVAGAIGEIHRTQRPNPSGS
jgi:hypothetical protein